MNEEQINRLLLITSAVVTGVAALACVGLIIEAAMQFSWAAIIGAILLAGCAVGGGMGVSYYGSQVTGRHPVFDNAAEREVLTLKQRRHLRRKRGEVVMEKALIDIEHEKDNIVHNLELEAVDPDVPPHETPWTKSVEEVPQIRMKKEPSRCDHDRLNGECTVYGCKHY